jgi:hypothetical protein
MNLQTPIESQQHSSSGRLGWSALLFVVAGLAAVLLLAAVVRWQDSSNGAAAPMAAPVPATTPMAPGFSAGGAPAGTGLAGATAEENVQQPSPAWTECEIVAYPTTC